MKKSRPKPTKPKPKRKAAPPILNGRPKRDSRWKPGQSGNPDTQFKPGHVANPAGRPPGARSRLTESFIAAVAAEFDRRGTECLRQLDARDFVHVALALVPRNAKLELEQKVPLWQRPEDMNEEQWRYFFGASLPGDTKPEDLQ